MQDRHGDGALNNTLLCGGGGAARERELRGNTESRFRAEMRS